MTALGHLETSKGLPSQFLFLMIDCLRGRPGGCSRDPELGHLPYQPFFFQQKGVGMTEPLVDCEDYPRADVDLYQVRTARHNIACEWPRLWSEGDSLASSTAALQLCCRDQWLRHPTGLFLVSFLKNVYFLWTVDSPLDRPTACSAIHSGCASPSPCSTVSLISKDLWRDKAPGCQPCIRSSPASGVMVPGPGCFLTGLCCPKSWAIRDMHAQQLCFSKRVFVCVCACGGAFVLSSNAELLAWHSGITPGGLR